MEQLTEIIIQLVGNEVCGKELNLSVQTPFEDQMYIDLFEKSREHNVLHLVASALKKNGLLADGAAGQAYLSHLYNTVFRSERMGFVFESVCKVLEDNAIRYIPLKGTQLRNLYPEKWMRSSVDMDILVHEKDLHKAVEKISRILGYAQQQQGKHDITVVSPEKIPVELHFRLIEEEHKLGATRLLDKVWDYAAPCKPDGMRYRLDDSFFYLYHISHMAKHFVQGGCGIRPFLDLWLMNNKTDYSDEKTRQLLRKAGMDGFEEYAAQLSRVWFSGEEHNQTTRIMQEYIIRGGTFGTHETRMLSDQQHHGGRLKHVFKRIFVPFDDLAYVYPIIKKYPFLTPFCEIGRLFSLIFGKKRKFRKIYISNLNDVNEEDIKKIRNLFERVKL